VVEALRATDPAALRRFLESALAPPFLAAAPIDLHLEQFGRMRATLGSFETAEIRLEGPDRADLLLTRGDGERFLLHLETEPREPFRIAGIGLEAYDPRGELPELADLAELDRRLARMTADGFFSGVVLVERAGEPTWLRAYGLADRDREIPVRADTRFDIGSITKDFTAVAVLQLVARGEVELEAPLGRYLRGFRPEIAERVRVVDLLRMESGFGDIFVPEFAARRANLRTIDDFLALVRTFDLEFAPGTDRRYSNAGYVLLGAIVEKVSGVSFADYLREHVLRPAGMDGAAFRDAERRDAGTAIGYTRRGSEGGALAPNRDLLEPKGSPAGGIVASAEELVRFYRALHGGRLLDLERTRYLLARFEPGAQPPPMRGVAGGAPGISAVHIEDTAAGVEVVVLANCDEPIAEKVGERVFELVLRTPAGESPARSEPKSVSSGDTDRD
jgi:CubicO group peptidase (beta-lactamase class C family)